MITGRQTLGSIDSGLQEQRGKLAAIEQRIDALSQRLIALQAQQVNDYRELAQHRVDDLAAQEAGSRVLGHLDDTQRQVGQLLEQRQTALKALADELARGEQESLELETRRAAKADEMEALDERLDAIEAEVQQQLGADSTYMAQRERADESRRIAEHAREKATRSQRERQQKGGAYENDALFMYLLQRQYGTRHYSANALIESMDGWVAGLVGYHDARANYQRLLDIPQRLDEHASAKEQEAEDAFEGLSRLDAEALHSQGAEQLSAELQSEQQELDAIDQRLDQVSDHYQSLLSKREHYASGEDETSQRIVRYLSDAFAHDDLRDLRDDALATPYPEDDAIVDRLMETEQEIGEAEQLARRLKNAMSEHRSRLGELEAARREFKARRYDNPRSGFSDGALVGVVLGELLNGALKSDSLWDVLDKQQRPRKRRSSPDFGSGGFGRGTPWGGGSSRRSPPRRRGGFGGGGFSTGGGFGGGDGKFRTGGGF